MGSVVIAYVSQSVKVFLKTSLRIFRKVCMNERYHKCRKVTEPNFWKKFLIWDNPRLVSKITFFRLFFGTTLRIFFIFCMIAEDNEVHHLSQIAIFRKFIDKFSPKGFSRKQKILHKKNLKFFDISSKTTNCSIWTQN